MDRTNDHTEDEPIRTLYLTGFPPDLKHREVHNLFRHFQGYEDSIVKANGVVFACFINQEYAMVAQKRLHGINFDSDSADTLRVEFAKQNSKRRKDAEGENGLVYEFWSQQRQDQRTKKAQNYSNSYPPMTDPSMYAMYRGLYGYPTTNYNPYLGDPYLPPQPNAYGRRLRTRYPPCDTLFVTNIGSRTSENDLIELFSRYDGFVKLQIYSKNMQNIGAFVQYRDLDSSTNALAALNGTALPTSDGPLRIEYAKSKMVIKREHMGNGSMRQMGPLLVQDRNFKKEFDEEKEFYGTPQAVRY